MVARTVFVVLPAVLLVSAPASAHFKLQQPADWLQTDAAGDPLGTTGTQKMNPCGQGTPSGAITQVRAGSTLHITLTETVPHGGHYRVALLPKFDPATTDIPEPAVTLASGECDSAAIESPVIGPVLADNLFSHTQAEAVSGKVWETDVQVPDGTGTATLQVLEFMTPHAPPCFYHHCARLAIVPADANITDDGGGAGGDGGPSAAIAPAVPSATNSSTGGCNAAGNAAPSPVTITAFGLFGLSMLRRRRNRG